MIHIVIGIAAIIWGAWKILPDWMFVGEVLKILIFVALVMFGIVAVSAGLRRVRTNN